MMTRPMSLSASVATAEFSVEVFDVDAGAKLGNGGADGLAGVLEQVGARRGAEVSRASRRPWLRM